MPIFKVIIETSFLQNEQELHKAMNFKVRFDFVSDYMSAFYLLY